MKIVTWILTSAVLVAVLVVLLYVIAWARFL